MKLGFFQGGRDIVDKHVGQPMRRHVRHGARHHPTANAIADLNHGVRHARIAHVFQLPVKQLLIKRLRLLQIVRLQFHMHKGVAHYWISLINSSNRLSSLAYISGATSA